jgi:Uma2 family endonuclease
VGRGCRCRLAYWHPTYCWLWKLSPGSRNVDLQLKPFEYAQAQIPHYWIVDLDLPAPSITVFHLGAPGDGYIEEPATAGQLVTSMPFDLHIDTPALVTPRS